METIHNFSVGDIVTVFNGHITKFEIEGRAVIKKILKREDMYKVQFLDEDKFGFVIYERYVDPNGQENPEEYLKQLNSF